MYVIVQLQDLVCKCSSHKIQRCCRQLKLFDVSRGNSRDYPLLSSVFQVLVSWR